MVLNGVGRIQTSPCFTYKRCWLNGLKFQGAAIRYTKWSRYKVQKGSLYKYSTVSAPLCRKDYGSVLCSLVLRLHLGAAKMSHPKITQAVNFALYGADSRN